MSTTLVLTQVFTEEAKEEFRKSGMVKGWKRSLLWLAIKTRIFMMACLVLKNPVRIIKLYRQMLRLRTNVWGGDLRKIYRVGEKYYFNQYTPGWPSAAYDQLIVSELRRQANPAEVREKLSFVFLAITRKCPMRCEHCFEWDNLNQKESFTREDLFNVIDLYRKEGVLQMHFSGGEPMVRYKDLLPLIRYASASMECWVLSSGFNLNETTAAGLKEAGCRGVVISIDHYIPECHDMFRGKASSFAAAVAAVKAVQASGMVSSLSVCATRAFLDGGHLLPYMEFAKSLGVQFVQVLEPRQIGHYAHQEVLRDDHHIKMLEEIFTTVNHDAAYSDHPTMLYHGFHQRRVGCFSGSRSVYVDSAGDVHACPFCHTKSYNIITLVRSKAKTLPQKLNECPLFQKIA